MPATRNGRAAPARDDRDVTAWRERARDAVSPRVDELDEPDRRRPRAVGSGPQGGRRRSRAAGRDPQRAEPGWRSTSPTSPRREGRHGRPRRSSRGWTTSRCEPTRLRRSSSSSSSRAVRRRRRWRRAIELQERCDGAGVMDRGLGLHDAGLDPRPGADVVGRLTEARAMFEQELALYEQHAMFALRQEVLCYLAELESRAGRWELAVGYAAESMDIIQESGQARRRARSSCSTRRGLRPSSAESTRLGRWR